MEINHRIALCTEDPFWREIDRLGLDYRRGDPSGDRSVLNITETHSAWPDVERLIAALDVGIDRISNVYTKIDLDSAEWLAVHALEHQGYPQPEDVNGNRQVTYNLSDYCPICATQNATFRLRSEPKASRSQFLQLNWVFDEFLLAGFDTTKRTTPIYSNSVTTDCFSTISDLVRISLTRSLTFLLTMTPFNSLCTSR